MCHWILLLLIKFGVGKSEDLIFFNYRDDFEEFPREQRGSARFLDFDNYRGTEELLENYRSNYPSPTFSRYHPRDLYDRSDTLHFPNIEQVFSSYKKLHSDHGEFVTPTAYDYDNSMIEITKGVPLFDENYYELQNRRPKFHTKKYENNFTQNVITIEKQPFVQKKLSYVQKIPKRDQENIENVEENPNRYEEIDMIASPTTNYITTKNNHKNNNSNTRKKINNILKRYLAKLYTQKYNTKEQNTTNNYYDKKQKHSKLQEPNADDQKSKFLNSETFLQIKNKTLNKLNNFFSIFTVAKFNNTECNATNWAGTLQGICYTAPECTKYNGTALGNCANGYGVCCVFKGTCGGSSNQNCTYFKSPNYPDYYPSDGGGDGSDGGVVVPTTLRPTTSEPDLTPDPRWPYWYRVTSKGNSREHLERQNDVSMSCVFSVFKKNNDVKQMRVDFIDLELAGPTNGTCTNERLVITGQNTNNQVPAICGYNSGQHVYVDVSTLSGPLQLMVLSNTGARKRFKIRICQLSDNTCTSPNSNCLQYYTGATGVIQSFNYDQAATLNRSMAGYFNNLNYAICIRKEAGYCSITYTNVRNGVEYPFQLVNVDNSGDLTIPPGQAGVDITNCPDDYVVIDGTRLCGDKFNDGSVVEDFTMNAPVTDTSAGPIVVSVRTDSRRTGIGFKLFYMQNLCTSG